MASELLTLPSYLVCEQDGAKLAVEMAEFWLKDQWTTITQGWSGVIRENPWSEEPQYHFHLNMMHNYFDVSLLKIVFWCVFFYIILGKCHHSIKSLADFCPGKNMCSALEADD